jgi:predicted dehydrogenase
MSVGVIGSGFGAYGYIPALIKEGNIVNTLRRYRSKFDSRPELQEYIREIHFLDEMSELVRLSEKLVVALPPDIQNEFISTNELSGKKMFLEKPLGVSSVEHVNVLRTLISKKIDFRVAYLFLYTDWYEKIRETNFDTLEIFWSFPWPQDGWKSELVDNYGASVYYGIHFYPVLLSLGSPPQNVITTETSRELRIKSSSPRVIIYISDSDEHNFEVAISLEGTKHSLFKKLSPFGDIPRLDELDPRIESLQRYLSDRSEISTTNKSIEIENYIEVCRFNMLGNRVQN